MISTVSLPVLLLSLLVTTIHAAPVGDEVTKLPGWSGPLVSRLYSGFVHAGTDKTNSSALDFYYWYMFVEAEVDDPSKAPLILWSNGGPGASSAYGFFTEMGPYYLSDQSLLTPDYLATGVPTLFRNPNAWSRFANVLILNGGGPVGFTYCLPAGPTAGASRCGDWDDDMTARHNQQFVANWFATAFPEYATNELYLIGESYAGVYMSMLMDAIIHTPSTANLNTRGLALGDACMGTDILCGAQTGPWYDLLFKGGHMCMSTATFVGILEQCDHAALKSGDLSHITPQCQVLLNLADVECPDDSFYEYNYYDKCSNPDFSITTPASGMLEMLGSPAEPNGYPCGGNAALEQWINLTDVKVSLNVPANAVYFSGDNGAGYNYTYTYTSAIPLLRELTASNGKYRTMIYNGDSDPGITSMRAQNWTATAMQLNVVSPWSPWTYDAAQQQVGGAIIRYEGDFQFVQVKGSGHMVPMYAPVQAYTLFNAWVNNQPLPPFNPPPPPPSSMATKRRGRPVQRRRR